MAVTIPFIAVGTTPSSHIPRTLTTNDLDILPTISMTSSGTSKGSRRKVTRSVSTLTPSQLARKRANDREAQRAIRARTKEHIEKLEQEVEDLKRSQTQSGDERVQDLLRKNRMLGAELARLRESMSVMGRDSQQTAPHLSHVAHSSALSSTSYPSTPTLYDDNLSSASGAISSPRTSPFPTADYSSLGADASYNPVASYNSNVGSISHSHNHHAHQHLSSSSAVSSPCSSCAHPDTEYVAAGASYIPTSIPASMQRASPAHLVSSGRISGPALGDEVPMSVPLGGLTHSASASPHAVAPPGMVMGPFPQGSANADSHVNETQQGQQNWGVYDMYYSQQVQSPVH